MANKSLTDLTARTATADSDLIHVNSGGTDYKETKLDFLEGEFNIYFTNNSLLTTQVDALTKQGTYFGRIEAYGHTTETGVPVNEYCWVKVLIYSSAMRTIEIWGMNSFDTKHYYISKLNGTWGSWTQAPSRSEITSINNSLTKSFSSYTANQNVSVSRLIAVKVAGIFICSGVFVLDSAFSTGASLFKLSNIAPYGTTDFLVFAGGSVYPCYVDAYGWVHCNATIPTGTYFFNFGGSLV